MIYIHVPFCKSFCIYCDFYSEIAADGMFEAYTREICAEIKRRGGEMDNTLKTLYFGGGTPSVLPLSSLTRILLALEEVGHGGPYTEFTLEVNPEDIVEKGLSYVQSLKMLGVNRISIGIQSLDNDMLRWMNRRHDAQTAKEAFRLVREAGFDNISVDLIFGLSNLSTATWESTIDQVLEMGPEHISCYQMMGRWADADEERCRRQYNLLQERLLAAGYRQYEISNYALPGRESRHNSAYWSREPYLGFGAGAHSFDGDRLRRWNTPDIDAYIETSPFGSEQLTDREILEEKLMLGLRTTAGLDLATLSPAEQAQLKKTTLEELSRAGKLMVEAGRIRIPQKELFVSDWIVSQLFPD